MNGLECYIQIKVVEIGLPENRSEFRVELPHEGLFSIGGRIDSHVAGRGGLKPLLA